MALPGRLPTDSANTTLDQMTQRSAGKKRKIYLMKFC